MMALTIVSAKASELDFYLLSIQKNTQINPFEIGEHNAKKHPLYNKLEKEAHHLGAKIEWQNSVSKRVLELPYSENRMKIKEQDEFDGWFDEYTTPNLIIIHKDATLATLVHEIRHAIHLGQHDIDKNVHWFDFILQQNKRLISLFKVKLNQLKIAKTEREKLNKLSTRLLETCSEISAHQGDLSLAQEFDQSLISVHQNFIKDYKNEFTRSYNLLKKNPISRNEIFVENLNLSLLQYMKEKKGL